MNRYFWILMTLITRPLFWFFMALAVAVSIGMITLRSDKTGTHTVKIVDTRDAIDSQEELLERIEHPGSTPVQIRLHHIAFDRSVYRRRQGTDGQPSGSGKELEVTGPFEIERLNFPDNVEALEAGSLSEKMMPRMGEFKSLKRLALQGSANDFPDMSPLGDLQQLEVLQLSSMHRGKSLKPLQSLPRLQTLSVDHSFFDEESLAEIAKLPALTTLHLYRAPPAYVSIGELAKSKSLKTIYLPVSLGESDAIEWIQAQVPSVRVRSSFYRRSRHALFGASIWFVVMASMLGQHFFSQFQLAQAELVPGYKAPHAKVMWAVMGATTIFLAIGACVWMGGAHWWPSVSAIGLVVVMMMHGTFASQRFLRRANATDFILRICLALLAIGVVLYSFLHPLPLEQFLMGDWPVTTLALNIAAVGFAIQLQRRSKTACRERYAMGTPLILSLRDMQKVVDQSPATAFRRQPSQMVNPHDRAKWLVYPGIVLLLVVLLRFAMLSANVGNFFTTNRLVVSQLAIAAGILPLVMAVFIGAKWWQEMPYLALMVPRPPLRERQIDSLLSGVLKDFVRKVIPAALAVILLAVSAPFWAGGDRVASVEIVFRVAACVLFAVAIIALAYSLTLWALLIRSVLGTLALVMVSYSVVSGVAVFLTIIGIDTKQGLPPWRVVLTSAVCMVIAFFAIRAARSRFQRLEWATLL